MRKPAHKKRRVLGSDQRLDRGPPLPAHYSPKYMLLYLLYIFLGEINIYNFAL